MAFLNTIRLIANHPVSKSNYLGAFRRYVNWQIACRMLPGEFVYQWLGGVKFIVRKGETGLVEAIYMGLLEFEDMAFFLHCIDNRDLFVDVGANVGMYGYTDEKARRFRSKVRSDSAAKCAVI